MDPFFPGVRLLLPISRGPGANRSARPQGDGLAAAPLRALLRCVLVFCLAALPAAAPAQQAPRLSGDSVEAGIDAPFRSGKPLLLQHFTRKDGLLENEVSAILQDRQGFLWFGTNRGLQRYDGYSFTSYAPDPSVLDAEGFQQVRSLCQDREGMLWVGMHFGLYRLDPLTGTWTYFGHDPDDPHSLSTDIVSVVYEDRAGTLWVGTGFRLQQIRYVSRGLNRFNPATETFTHYRHDPDDPASLSHDYVTAIHEDHTGTFWVGTYQGLNRMDRSTGAMRRYLDGRWIRAIYADRSGTLWVVTAQGLYHFDRQAGAFRAYTGAAGTPVGRRITDVTDIAEDRAGVLWIGTRDGLFRLERATGRLQRYLPVPDDPHSLTAAHVQDLYVDRSGILWIATGEPGLSTGALEKLDPALQVFDVYQHERYEALGLKNKMARALMEDRHGQVWVGTFDDPAIRFDPETGQVTRTPFYGAITFHEDRLGRIWVGMYEREGLIEGGLARYDPGTGRSQVYRHDPNDSTSLGSNRVLEIYEDRAGTLWIGTSQQGGLNRFNPTTETFTRYRHDPNDPTSLGRDRVNILYEDRAGAFWVGTWEGGLNRFDRSTGTFTRYMHRSGDSTSLSGNRVFGIHEDRAGRFWVGTYRSLHLLVPDAEGTWDPARVSFRRFTTQNSNLPSDWVMAMSEDAAGYLWLMMPSSIVRFNPETYAVETFDAFNRPSDIPYIWDAHDQGRDGTLYFGGVGGFVVVNPAQVQHNTTPPEIRLTGLKIFNQPVQPGPDAPLRKPLSATDTLTLTHGQNDLEIGYVGLHYRDPARNQYAYRLDGYDATWREVGSQRTATYTGLAPGSYTFRVKASNSDGVWNEEGATLHLTVLPPWWRTWWAYALYVAALAALVYGGYAWRIRRLKAHARELRLMVRERTRELQAEKEKTEAQALRLAELDEAKSRFFANISHEFRTPLTLILGPLQDLLDRRTSPEALARNAPAMHRNARRLLRLVNQLLDLSRLESGKLELQPEAGDLARFTADLTRSFVPLAERRRITLTYHGDADALPLRFDPDAMEKVLANLISNALKFTPEGGKAVVSLKTGGGHVEIAVKDTGPGIDREDLARIFDRFEQADTSIRRRYEGSGLGLALARELVELHGGDLHAESEPGFGSTFTVRLPRISLSGEREIIERPSEAEADRIETEVLLTDGNPEPTEAAQPQAEPDPFRVFGKPRILIVEDNADVRAYLRANLGDAYRLLEAEDGEAGLEAAHQHEPDLVLSDVMMPKMDGYEMCRRLKADERLHEIPVLLLTARATEQDTVEGLESGADDYLAKPFGVPELLARIEHLIRTRRELRAQYSREVVVRPADIAIQPEEEAFLERVLEVVETHLGDANFTVDWLAEEVGLSRRQLERRVKAVTEETPSGLVRRMRLERASQLLRARAGTVSEIAYAVGFKSPAHFSSAFREVYGEPPTAHRAAPTD